MKEKELMKIYCFLENIEKLLDLDKDTQNNIRNILDALIEISKLKASQEAMSIIYESIENIEKKIEVKSDDFRYDAMVIAEIEVNFNDFFAVESERDEISKLLSLIEEKNRSFGETVVLAEDLKKICQ